MDSFWRIPSKFTSHLLNFSQKWETYPSKVYLNFCFTSVRSTIPTQQNRSKPIQSKVHSEAIWIVKILILISPFCIIPKFTPEFHPNTSVYSFTLKDKLSIPLIEKKHVGIHSEKSCRCLIKVLGCAASHHSPFPASCHDIYHDSSACLTFLHYIMKSWKAGMRSSHIYSSYYAQHNSVYLVRAHPLWIDQLNDDLIQDFLVGSIGAVICLPKALFLLSLGSLAPWFTPGHSFLPKALYHPAPSESSAQTSRPCCFVRHSKRFVQSPQKLSSCSRFLSEYASICLLV